MFKRSGKFTSIIYEKKVEEKITQVKSKVKSSIVYERRIQEKISQVKSKVIPAFKEGKKIKIVFEEETVIENQFVFEEENISKEMDA